VYLLVWPFWLVKPILPAQIQTFVSHTLYFGQSNPHSPFSNFPFLFQSQFVLLTIQFLAAVSPVGLGKIHGQKIRILLAWNAQQIMQLDDSHVKLHDATFRYHIHSYIIHIYYINTDITNIV
jgi:hypothetical protein